MKDRQLWKGMLSGDKSSLELIYREQIDSLYNYGKRFTSDQQLVEDCIQNLFIDIWEKRTNLGETDHIRPYLFLSLRRRLLKESKHKLRKVSIEDISYKEKQFDFDVESILIKRERDDEKKEKLKNSLNELSEKQKEIIYLKFVQNLSNSEIAKLLSINNQSVRNSLHRVISKLKKSILFFLL